MGFPPLVTVAVNQVNEPLSRRRPTLNQGFFSVITYRSAREVVVKNCR
jgi:hypothetical protein